MQNLRILPKNLKEVIRKTIEVIMNGGIVVCPTDTVYGLIANAKDKIAVKRVFEIKKRSFEKPLPVFIKNLEMAKSLANIDGKQEKILKKFWPGKLTVILKAKPIEFPQGILSKDKKIGLRIPNYKFLNLLLREIGRPLTSTSANISGKSASVDIREVSKQFISEKVQPDLVLDAGKLKSSLPSTVIDLINFKTIREGEISLYSEIDKKIKQ